MITSQTHSPHDSHLSSRLSLPCLPPSAGRARAFVREHLHTAGFDEDALGEIIIAVGEAVTNSIEHGTGPSAEENARNLMELRVYSQEGSLVIEVRDQGPGFDPNKVRRTDRGDAIEERGRGLTIIHALMDNVTITRSGEGAIVRMTRRLPG